MGGWRFFDGAEVCDFWGFTAGGRYAIIEVLVPSSSGLGRLVLIQKIAGSTPAGITMRVRISADRRFFVGF